MAIIIETCPKCGHDLIDIMIDTYPPIPKKECTNCDWSWTGKPEQIIRRTFGGNEWVVDDLVKLEDYTSLNLTDLNIDKIDGGTIHIGDLKQGF